MNEGWMDEKNANARRYHYIVGSTALCGGYGFYAGDLTPFDPAAGRGAEDCAKCFKRATERHGPPASARAPKEA